MNITFWGATDEVTGSMTFLEIGEKLILVDAGMAQGNSEVERLNALKLPFEEKSIDAIFITHAHLDHSGYLPRLVKKGFRGHIYCTPATAQLVKVILDDSASLVDENFYSDKEVVAACHMINAREWNWPVKIDDSTFTFIPAGHILGASSLIIESEGKKIVFSGDLGRQDDTLIPAPSPCPEADIIIMESTYGAKERKGNAEEELENFLLELSRKHAVGIIASFAVARAQMLLTLIYEYLGTHPDNKIRVYMDGPMMKEANRVYKRFAHLTKRPEDLFQALDNIESIDFVRQWNSIKRKEGPLLIISSSGMLTGGRIWRHIQNWQHDPDAVLFLPGYQAAGTPGRALAMGERTLEGPREEQASWSGKVLVSEAFSSHADQNELITWVSKENTKARVFLLHGEKNSKKVLEEKLKNNLLEVEVPFRGQSFKI